MADINIQLILISIVPFLFSLSTHEAAHALAAYLMGDRTAKDLGRVTLNPLKHLDPLGLLVLLITRAFGWAKPVPVDFRIVSRKKYGPLFVAIAGPLSNIVLAVLSALVLIILLKLGLQNLFFIRMLDISIRINVVLAVLNMIPIPPLDGSRVLANLLPPRVAYEYTKIERYGFIIVMVLIYFKILTPFIRSVSNVLINTIWLCIDTILKY